MEIGWRHLRGVPRSLISFLYCLGKPVATHAKVPLIQKDRNFFLFFSLICFILSSLSIQVSNFSTYKNLGFAAVMTADQVNLCLLKEGLLHVHLSVSKWPPEGITLSFQRQSFKVFASSHLYIRFICVMVLYKTWKHAIFWYKQPLSVMWSDGFRQ